MNLNSKIYIAGHKGLVGSAIHRKLLELGYNNIIIDSSSPRLNLINQDSVEDFFNLHKPEYVFISAAKVGGIYANSTYPAQFIYNNLQIQCNIIEASRKNNVKKLLMMGSSCIYPKFSSNPIMEEYLLTGPLEPTNEYYAIAKIAGIKMCEAYRKEYGCNYITCQPTNIYGPNDCYNIMNSHVVPALIRKFHDAKINNQEDVELWGTGSALREFLHADDLAEACIFLMQKYDEAGLINIGSGHEISIKDLASLIQKTVGHNGNLIFDKSKPDGMMRKLLDCSKINNLGWHSKISLEDGLKQTYNYFINNEHRM